MEHRHPHDGRHRNHAHDVARARQSSRTLAGRPSRRSLAEFNANLIHGNFELSKEGGISFRTTTDVRGGLLTSRMVLNEIDHHFNIMQKYLPELRKLTEDDRALRRAGTGGNPRSHRPPCRPTAC